ncbi:hypothetical protein WJ64_03110 [Burkholderia ubonensis]|nr:hypothetical protein WJ64_03110 [Burkholderia ubonensis]
MFEPSHEYYSTTRDVLYGAGKQSLDQFCRLLLDDKIPFDTRKAAIEELALGLVVCGPGSATNLALASRNLMLAAGGIRAASWEAKEQLVRAHIMDFVRANHSNEMDYAEWEIHYHNAYANHVAGRLGLPHSEDVFMKALHLSDAQLERCADFVLPKATPGRLAMMMAGQFLSEVSEQLSQALKIPVHQLHAGFFYDSEAIEMTMSSLANKYGEGTCKLQSLLESDLDNFGQCRLHADPALLALDMLEAQRKEGLIDQAYQSQLILGWYAPDRVEIHQYDDQLVWATNQSQPELLGLSHLSKLKSFGQPLAPELREAIVQQVCHHEQTADLQRLPPQWLGGPSIELLLGKFDDAQCRAYFRSHESDFKPLQVFRLASVIVQQGRMGLVGDICKWLPPLEILKQWTQEVHGESRLGNALDVGNAKVVKTLDAILQLAMKNRHFAARINIYDMLRACGRTGDPGLHSAMLGGHTEATRAFLDMVMKADEIGHFDPEQISALLAAKDSHGTPALYRAMQNGRDGTVSAFVDAAVAAYGRGALTNEDFVDLMVAHLPGESMPGLFVALEEGHTRCVEAFAQGLVSARAQNRITAEHFVNLMTAKVEGGPPGLYAALRKGQMGTVNAFIEAAIESRLTGGINSEQFVELMAAKEPNGVHGLALARECGQTAVAKLFTDAMLTAHQAGGIDEKQYKYLTEARRPTRVTEV